MYLFFEMTLLLIDLLNFAYLWKFICIICIYPTPSPCWVGQYNTPTAPLQKCKTLLTRAAVNCEWQAVMLDDGFLEAEQFMIQQSQSSCNLQYFTLALTWLSGWSCQTLSPIWLSELYFSNSSCGLFQRY